MRQSAGHLDILLLEIIVFAVAVGDCIMEDGRNEVMEPNVRGKKRRTHCLGILTRWE